MLYAMVYNFSWPYLSCSTQRTSWRHYIVIEYRLSVMYRTWLSKCAVTVLWTLGLGLVLGLVTYVIRYGVQLQLTISILQHAADVVMSLHCYRVSTQCHVPYVVKYGLDWPLINASSLLSASAELLVFKAVSLSGMKKITCIKWTLESHNIYTINKQR